ncbi:MAG: hypothetical protein ABI374_12475 [Ginsengibacter sp.]
MICLILLNKDYFMSKEVKSKIYKMIDSIEDENTLQMVMEDIAYYASGKKVADELTKEQLKELDEAISEADNNKTLDWGDFKKEMNEWKKG